MIRSPPWPRPTGCDHLPRGGGQGGSRHLGLSPMATLAATASSQDNLIPSLGSSLLVSVIVDPPQRGHGPLIRIYILTAVCHFFEPIQLPVNMPAEYFSVNIECATNG